MRHEGVPRLFSRQAMGIPENHSTFDNGHKSSKSNQSHVQYGEFVEDSKTTFTEQRGCFLSYWRIGLLTVCILGALLMVGLLVRYVAPCERDAIPLTHISAQRITASENRQGRMQDNETVPVQTSFGGENVMRLPRNVQPLHYKLVIQPHLPPENCTLDGYVEIKVRCQEETKDIILHTKELKISSLNVTEVGSANLPVSGTSSNEDNEMFTIHLDEYLKPKSTYLISMEYQGVLNNQSMGLYRASYTNKDGEKIWVAASQLEPTDARRLLPCFDEPALKATFEVSVIRRKDVISLSNMPKWKTEHWDEEWELDLYNTTVPMSTYLLAFVIGKMAPFKNDDMGQFQVWGRPEAVHLGEYAFSVGPKLLKFYEDLFEVPYPLPKTDMVAIPELTFYAMENWGLVIFREDALFFDPKRSSSEDLVLVTVVIAHELAHQWFGNLVTAAWWDDIWLHEGFATYLEYIGSQAVQPEWGMDQQFLLDTYAVFETDSLISSHAVSSAVAAESEEIMELFDQVSYLKGGSIIRMMEHFLGSENFRQGLKVYLKTYSYKTATREDLWRSLNQTSEDIDVKKIMNTWTMQRGYPVVTVTRDYKTNSASIRQTTFTLDSDESNALTAEERNRKVWTIPITYTTGDDPTWTTETRIWLSDQTGSISELNASDEWLLLNVQQVGFYRVNYDTKNWDLLIQQLVTHHQVIHVINRGQIINDALNLARSGHLPYPLALNMTLYLLQEKDFLPWKGALLAFRYMDLMLAKSDAYGTWKEFVLLLMTPIYESLGWSPASPQENMLTRLLRTQILKWTCAYGGDDCIETAIRTFKQWKQSPQEQQSISPDVLEVVLCTGVAYGTSKDWDFVWQRYLKEDLASEKYRLLKSLACTREPWLLERFLRWVLRRESDIKPQDSGTVFEAVSENVYARDIMYNFFRSNWQEIYSLYGSKVLELSDIVEHSTCAVNSEHQLQELRVFLNRRSSDNIGAVTNAFRRSIERSSANVRWMYKNADVITEWLHNKRTVISPIVEPILQQRR